MRKILALLLLMLPFGAVAEPALLMAEEPGCHWCARWDEEIAHIYPKTPEGRAAPLRRFDLRAQPPEVEFARPVHYTPTFILVEDGRELGRIEGYPGADFFWGLLGAMLEQAGVPVAQGS